MFLIAVKSSFNLVIVNALKSNVLMLSVWTINVTAVIKPERKTAWL